MDGTKAIPCQTRRENKSDSSLPNFSFTTIVGPMSSSYSGQKSQNIKKNTTYTPNIFLNLYYLSLCKRNFDDAIKILSLCQESGSDYNCILFPSLQLFATCEKLIYNISSYETLKELDQLYCLIKTELSDIISSLHLQFVPLCQSLSDLSMKPKSDTEKHLNRLISQTLEVVKLRHKLLQAIILLKKPVEHRILEIKKHLTEILKYPVNTFFIQLYNIVKYIKREASLYLKILEADIALLDGDFNKTLRYFSIIDKDLSLFNDDSSNYKSLAILQKCKDCVFAKAKILYGMNCDPLLYGIPNIYIDKITTLADSIDDCDAAVIRIPSNDSEEVGIKAWKTIYHYKQSDSMSWKVNIISILSYDPESLGSENGFIYFEDSILKKYFYIKEIIGQICISFIIGYENTNQEENENKIIKLFNDIERDFSLSK